MTRVLVIALATLLIALSSISSAELIATQIHTLGFPAGFGDLLSLLHYLSLLQNASAWPSVEELARLIQANCTSLSCLAEDPSIAQAIEQVLREYNMTYSMLANASTRDLIDMISSEEWARLLSEIATAESPSTEVLEQLAIEAMLAMARGDLSLADYLIVLEVLRRLSENAGAETLAGSLSSEQIRALTEAARRLLQLREGGVAVGEPSTGFWSRLLQVESPPLLPESLKARLPAVSAPREALAYLLLASALVLLAYSLLGIAARGAGIPGLALILRRGDSRVVDYAHGSRIVQLYWRGVKLVERIAGKPMEVTHTHREYLKLVESDLGDKAQAFRSLTLDYELHRFGGVPDEQLLPDAERSLRVLSSRS
ncbi:MAG: hypothetical protein QXS85_05910 [Acidilobaceae archaeon]